MNCQWCFFTEPSIIRMLLVEILPKFGKYISGVFVFLCSPGGPSCVKISKNFYRDARLHSRKIISLFFKKRKYQNHF